MTFDWSEYLALAQEMAELTANACHKSTTDTKANMPEARLRSSISRSYYAAYCSARNYLRDFEHDRKLLRNRDRDFNEHQYVAQEFTNKTDKNSKEIGKDLSRLREHRNRSDYDDIFGNLNSLKKEADFCLKLARNIIENLKKIS